MKMLRDEWGGLLGFEELWSLIQLSRVLQVCYPYRLGKCPEGAER